MASESQRGISRRDFGKTAAAAGFAILTARQTLAQSATDTIRIGLIGCGGRGTGAAQNCLEGNENVQLVAMADLFEDSLKSSRAKLEGVNEIAGKVAVTDEMCFVGWDAYEKLLATDVHMIIHGTPPYARPGHILAAAQAGKHIFTEKPVAVDAPGIRMFREAAKIAEEKKLSLVAGTQRRHQKSYIDTIQKIKDGAIGDIVSAHCYWIGSTPWTKERAPGQSDVEYQIRNWVNYVWTSGDNIVEQHVHNLDVINWIMGGPPKEAIAQGGRAWKPAGDERYGDMWDSFAVEYTYENGVILTSLCRHWNDSYNRVQEDVIGTKGASRCRDMGEDDRDPYVQEHIDLLKSIRNEGPYLNEGQQIADSTMTAIMGRMAAYTGQRMRWAKATEDETKYGPEKLEFGSYPLPPLAVPGMKKKDRDA